MRNAIFVLLLIICVGLFAQWDWEPVLSMTKQGFNCPSPFGGYLHSDGCFSICDNDGNIIRQWSGFSDWAYPLTPFKAVPGGCINEYFYFGTFQLNDDLYNGNLIHFTTDTFEIVMNPSEYNHSYNSLRIIKDINNYIWIFSCVFYPNIDAPFAYTAEYLLFTPEGEVVDYSYFDDASIKPDHFVRDITFDSLTGTPVVYVISQTGIIVEPDDPLNYTIQKVTFRDYTINIDTLISYEFKPYPREPEGYCLYDSLIDRYLFHFTDLKNYFELGGDIYCWNTYLNSYVIIRENGFEYYGPILGEMNSSHFIFDNNRQYYFTKTTPDSGVVRKWYDGFNFGNYEVFDPSSLSVFESLQPVFIRNDTVFYRFHEIIELEDSIVRRDVLHPFENTGVMNIENDKQQKSEQSDVLTIYPNPASNFIEVSSKKTTTIEIYDIRGKRLLTSQLNDSKLVKLDISKLDTGVYCVKALCYGNIFTGKFIVINN